MKLEYVDSMNVNKKEHVLTILYWIDILICMLSIRDNAQENSSNAGYLVK